MKNRLMDTVGEGEGGMIRENGIETYTLPQVKQIASGNLIYDTGNPKWVLCDNLEGWGGDGGGAGGESRGRGHMYAYGQFMLLYGRGHHNIAIILQLNK